VTLAPGGAYTDPVVFQANEAILQAGDAMNDFIALVHTNATFFAQWPEVGVLAQKIADQKDGWIRDAYVARNAYVDASNAYKTAVAAASKAGTAPPDGSAVDASKSKLDGLVAALLSVTTSAADYKAAHPVTAAP
jgi:hypothetical protein